MIPPPKRRLLPFFIKPLEDHATAMMDDMYEMEEQQWSDDDSSDDDEMPTVIYGVCLDFFVFFLSHCFLFSATFYARRRCHFKIAESNDVWNAHDI